MGKNNRQRRAMKKRKKMMLRKDRQKNKMGNKEESIGPSLLSLNNPFADLTDDERQEVIQEIAKNSEKVYQESLSKIKELLTNNDPIILLSVLASYGLTVNVGADGIQTKDSDLEIHQAHVEICQGLALQLKAEDLIRSPFGPDVVTELKDALINLMLSDSHRNFEMDFKDRSDDVKAIKLLQQFIRANTHMVRNWGYFSQVKNISIEIYGYFDELLNKNYGFSVSNVIDVFQLFINEIEDKNTRRFESLAKLYNIKDKNDLVCRYYELIGQAPEDAEQLLGEKKIDSIPFKTLFLMLMSHYDLRLPENYTFTLDHLSKEMNIDIIVTKNLLDEFSFSWGSLESYETEHLYLSNPVWLRPLIKIDEDKYFCVIPQTFFSFIIPSLDRLIGNLDGDALSERRANYLEEKIVEIIGRRFPDSNTVSGIKWQYDELEYETDLVTFIDSHALIVEAKSGKISEPALRGAPDRLKKHIEEIIIEPNIQSKRLKDKLEELIANPDMKDELREKLPVDLNNIHKILRVSVSLEDFGSIQANITGLKETGWLSEDFEPCPTMNLADFETLFDFLEHPVQIIHYLEGRQEIENELDILGDELDFMGLYITTLFNVGGIEPDTNLIITEMSAPLDAYYNSKDAGINIPKPEPKISPLFNEIFNQLEQRNTPRWTEIGVILNKISPDDQMKLSKYLIRLNKKVRKTWMIDGHENIVIIVPPKSSMYAICYVMYLDANSDSRNEFIEAAAKKGLDQEHVKYCLVIAKNIDKDDLAYHFIGLFK